MRIAAIFLDLDGTLLTSSKEISRRNYEALRRAHESGAYIVPATGRFLGGIPETVRALPFVRYFVASNGADIYDSLEQKTIFRAEIPIHQAEEVFDVLDTLPVIYDCFMHSSAYISRDHYQRLDQYIRDPPRPGDAPQAAPAGGGSAVLPPQRGKAAAVYSDVF